MSSKYILISKYPLNGNEFDLNSLNLKNSPETKYYFFEDDSSKELLELRSFNDIKEISWDEGRLESVFHDLAKNLSGDIRRELIKFVESPINNNELLPQTKYIQLRHVEVPSNNYFEYRKWRDETIFNVVRENKDKIESFEAFHSLISGQPGVMFISSFNEDIKSYTEAFTNEKYKDIIKQAGDSYITGGNEGLYTKIYQSCS